MADDVIFQEAVDALRGGNKARAREVLTGLIKTDQNNVEYWIWLSAAMETTKERVYCLQTALKLDPDNATAKRGLILLGALPADETIQPFPMNRPRAWEERLLLAHEKPTPKGWAAVRASPVFRLGLVILLVGVIGGAIAFGLVIPSVTRTARQPTSTPGPVQTFTPTVTAIGGRPQTQVAGTPGGLADFFNVQYTPTPLYVPTERSPETSDYLLRFDRAYKQGDWDEAIAALEDVIKLDENALFAYYYLGESYRFKGDLGNSQRYYTEAINRKPDFGAAYVGLARAQLLAQPTANVLPLLDNAVRYDPNFGEAYLERARVKIRDNDLPGAVADLGKANELLPGSPLVFQSLAQARLQEGDYELALSTAQQAVELDKTYLPGYLLLGRIEAALGNDAEAVKQLSFYLEYAPGDLAASIDLGKLQFKAGDYESSIRSMSAVIEADPNRREAYLYRLLANVELGNAGPADADIERVSSSYPDLFEANLAVVRAELLNNRNGNALLGLENLLALAETDEQKALAYYWSATVYERRKELRDAAANWEALLELPQEAMTAAMREEAQEKLLEVRTPSPTPSRTRTPPPTATSPVTPMRTPTPSRTPTP